MYKIRRKISVEKKDKKLKGGDLIAVIDFLANFKQTCSPLVFTEQLRFGSVQNLEQVPPSPLSKF